LDPTGKLMMECIVETKAATLLQFFHGLRGSLRVRFEEGTCAAWLHDLLKPYVTEVLVCDTRKMPCSKPGTTVTESMRGSWLSCCDPIFSLPSIMESTACEL